MEAIVTALESDNGVLFIHSSDGFNRNWTVWILFCLLLEGEEKFTMPCFTHLEKKYPIRLDIPCITWVQQFFDRIPANTVRGIAAYCERARGAAHPGGGSGCVVQ